MPAVENFALPGQWLITIEAIAAVLVLLLAGWRPLLAGGRRLGRLCRRLAARPRLVLIAVFVLAAGLTGLSFVVLGPPIPKVTDEYGHLLVADTWLQGRLANPAHPLWRHFDVYALQFPLYASKYPPGQGALLALGGLLGHKAIGPCLGAGLLAASFAWAFFRWLRPGWALFGSVLVLLRLAIGSYWHQSYWGGTVGAVGGALLLGALAPGRPKNRVVAALGLVLLASSRPFEGLVLALPCLFLLLPKTRKQGAPLKELAVLAAILLPAASGILYSNWKITGDALLFPQAGYVTAYGGEPDFVFQSRFGTWQGEQIRAPIRASELAKTLPPTPPEPWLSKALLAAPSRLLRSLYFYLGFVGSLAFLLGLVGLGKQRGWLLSTLALTTLAQGLPTFYFPHHASPPTFLFWLVALEGFRRAALSRWPTLPHRGRPGSRLLLLLLTAELLATTLRFPTLRPGPQDPSRQRQAIIEKLEKIPGRHLVIVEPRSMTDWVWNGADIDAAKIVWARTAGAEADQQLRDYYQDRQIWRARIDTEPPVLEPWKPSP